MPTTEFVLDLPPAKGVVHKAIVSCNMPVRQMRRSRARNHDTHSNPNHRNFGILRNNGSSPVTQVPRDFREVLRGTCSSGTTVQKRVQDSSL